MSSLTQQPLTQHYRIKSLGNLELLHTERLSDGYAKHLHEEYSLCWVQRGLVKTHYRGSSHLSPVQSFTVMNPTEPHRGEVLSEEDASYYSLYLSESAVQKVCEETFASQRLPYFAQPIILDDVLQQKLHSLIGALTNSGLELDSHYLSFTAHLLQHYTDTPLSLLDIKQEPSAVEEARAYLHAHFQEDISLDELAKVAGLNRAYLIRTFKKKVGLPPHAYLTQLRLSEAKKQLTRSIPIAQVALNTGFADQSHFSRVFKHIYGMTPGAYAKVRELGLKVHEG
jgi:AraC-like DNA-binding protein